MSVGDNNNRFLPPGAFNPRMLGSGQPQQQAFNAQPSKNAPMSNLYSQQQSAVKLPDLLGCLRTWHRGKPGRTPEGDRIILPWFALEVIHLDTATVIYPHQLDLDEQDEDICQLIEQKIEVRYRAFQSEMPSQRYEVRCHFRSEDGELSAWEPFTCNIHLAPQMQHYGQPHYGGMQGGYFNGQGYGGPFGAQGGGLGGGSSLAGLGQLANNSIAILMRGMTDDRQLSNIVLMRAIDMIENHSRRLEASNARHEDRTIDMYRLMDELHDHSATRKLNEQMAELKMAALQTALEKTLHALPMGFAVLNRWIQTKNEEKAGKITPRQKKAENVLKAIMNSLQKSEVGKDPQAVRMMLQGAGIDEETIDSAFNIFQEFYFDQMIADSEKKVKESILGQGEGENGIKRLLAAAGVKKEEEKKEDENGK
jgi:hypothetical protein